MAQRDKTRTSASILTGSPTKQTFNGIPSPLVDAVKELCPQHGDQVKLWTSLLAVFVSESCTDHARALLFEWADKAKRSPDSADLDSLASRFADAISHPHGGGAEGEPFDEGPT